MRSSSSSSGSWKETEHSDWPIVVQPSDNAGNWPSLDKTAKWSARRSGATATLFQSRKSCLPISDAKLRHFSTLTDGDRSHTPLCSRDINGRLSGTSLTPTPSPTPPFNSRLFSSFGNPLSLLPTLFYIITCILHLHLYLSLFPYYSRSNFRFFILSFSCTENTGLSNLEVFLEYQTDSLDPLDS